MIGMKRMVTVDLSSGSEIYEKDSAILGKGHTGEE